MSVKTGRAPVRQTAPAVAKKVNVGRMTSSPGPISRACRASDRASLPDEQATPCPLHVTPCREPDAATVLRVHLAEVIEYLERDHVTLTVSPDGLKADSEWN